MQVLKKYDSTETLLSVSADGCPANTGNTNGAIRLLEELLGRPVQWLICTLHQNELIFRHLFIALGMLILEADEAENEAAEEDDDQWEDLSDVDDN